MNIDWYVCTELKDKNDTRTEDQIDTYTFSCFNCKFIEKTKDFRKLCCNKGKSMEVVSLYSKIPFWKKNRLEQQLIEKRQKDVHVAEVSKWVSR